MDNSIQEAGSVTESVDWWSLEYNDLDEQLVCPICRTALVDPFCTDCGHTFCKECILATNRLAVEDARPTRCPIDRKPVLQKPQAAPLIVRAMLDSLEVACPFAARGCEFRGERWLLESHVAQECAFVLVACHPPCPHRVERRYFASECRCADQLPRSDASATPAVVRACPGSALGCTFVVTATASSNAAADEVPHSEQGTGTIAEYEAMSERKLAPEREAAPVQAEVEEDEPAEEDQEENVAQEEDEAAAEHEAEYAEHIKTCPMALMAPALRAQAEQIDAVRLENRALKRQLESAARNAHRHASELDSQILSEYERLWAEIQEASASHASQHQLVVKLSMENARMSEDLALLKSVVDSLRRQMQLMTFSNRRMSLHSSYVGLAGADFAPSEEAGDSAASEDLGRQRRSVQKL